MLILVCCTLGTLRAIPTPGPLRPDPRRVIPERRRRGGRYPRVAWHACVAWGRGGGRERVGGAGEHAQVLACGQEDDRAV